VSHVGDPLGVRSASAVDLGSVPGFNGRLVHAVMDFLRSSSLAEAEREADIQLTSLRESGAAILHLWHPAYPQRLGAIYDAPPVLFVQGSIDCCSGHCVAVVGTRRPTPYGLAVAEHFARELSAAGAVVVSGLARGIDARAHRAALDAGGKTIAVVGTGPDRCYPPENRRLSAEIAESGAVVSEYRPGTGPEPGNFPRRNRIISGLSLGTLVAESDTDGGAMITAYLALDQNRDVFAVPGNIHSGRSRGCHALIREGKAQLVTTAADVLDEIGEPAAPAGVRENPTGDAVAGLNGVESSVAGLVGAEPVHLDDIAGLSILTVPDLLVTLLSLEMKNVVRQLPGKYFIRRF
jgi:DNA processing protein